MATNYQSGVQVAESYNYDGNNRLTTTNRGGSLTSSRAYDPGGRVTQTENRENRGQNRGPTKPGTDDGFPETKSLTRPGFPGAFDVFLEAALRLRRSLFDLSGPA